MMTIEVDFDVFKELTSRRPNEQTSNNDVLRAVLGLAEKPTDSPGPFVGCIYQGVSFPEGTQFQATHKGTTYTAQIKGRVWVGEDGKRYNSPSHAARAVTGKNWNGWLLWKCRKPGETGWTLIDHLRSSDLAALA